MQSSTITLKRTFPESATEDEIFQGLLDDRGIDDITSFMTPLHPKDIPFSSLFDSKASFEIKWKKATNILEKFHKNHEKIVIYSDYDADGVTGGAIMWEGLAKLGFDVMPYIPDRKTEGYGFSEKGIDHVIKEFNPALIISVDHGIVGHKQISYAKKLGVPIIVTDHHQQQDGEPKDALAVFHTSQICGSAVAYFFIKELYKHFNKPLSDDYLALAAIGTIADLVPLTGASRSVAKYGLQALSTTPRLGLRHLIKEAGLSDKTIDAYHVGYVLAPRINAFGRLEHAIDALRLLCTTSLDKAVTLAYKAGAINKRRQDIVDTSVKEALKMVNPEDRIIILHSDNWEEGIMGLIAGKVMQKFYRPTIVMSGQDGFAKASVRSVDGVDIMKFLTTFKKYFIDMGGHKMAAGFTIEKKDIELFTKEAHEHAATEISDDMLLPTISVDAKISLAQANHKLASLISKMKPFGMGNAQPIFSINATVKDVKSLGANGTHTKLLLTDGEYFLEALLFNTAPALAPQKATQIEVIVELGVNEWNGRETVQAIIKQYELKL